MKKFKNTTRLLLWCAVSCFLLVGCTQSADKISSNQIVKLYNQQLKEQAQAQESIPIKVGYYETSSEQERCTLKKLEAAGLLTVSFERFAWWEKIEGVKKVKQSYYDYWSWSTVTRTVNKKILEYNFEDHIMANVALTPAGKKLVLKSLPEPVSKEDKDMIQPKLDSAKNPECFVKCEENWPYIENPFIEKKKEDTPQKTEPKKETKQKETPNEEDDEVTIERRDNKQYLAYQNALEKVNETEVHLKGCTVKAIKARNIQIVKENGISTAVAEVIVEKNNVTKAYSAIKQELNKTRTLEPVTLTYFMDKGWVIEEDFQIGFMKEYFETWKELCDALEDAADELGKSGEGEETEEEAQPE